ncbi:MAG TPA: hypothetical protein VK041_07555, partial [Opitutales bacterium]|nr:hypothetical protein [Opitutales bacterium]
MATFFPKTNARPERTDPPRRRRKTGEGSSFAYFLETSRVIAAILFIVTALIVGYLSFIGVSTAGPQLIPNQIAPMRITATQEFSYISQIATERERTKILQQVPPAFRIDMMPYESFAGKIRTLLSEINTLANQVEGIRGSDLRQAIHEFTSEYNRTRPHRINVEDVTILLQHTDEPTRRLLFDNGLVTLREIFREGIYAQDSSLHIGENERFSILNLVRPNGNVVEKTIQSEEQALQFLRINLTGLNVPQEVSIALFRIFRPGIVPNIHFDGQTTEELQQKAVASVEPVRRTVTEGQTMAEPGMVVTPEQHEMLGEYRRFLAEQQQHGFSFHFNELVFHRIFLVFAVLFGAVIYIRIEDRETLMSNGRLALLALVTVGNLFLIWLILYIGNHPLLLDNSNWLSVLPYLAPYSLAPLIVAILIGQRPAIFMTVLISFFAAVMFGNRVEVFAVSFLSSLCAIWFCGAIRVRKTIVQAAGAGGFLVALSAGFFGFSNAQEPLIVGQQMAGAQLAGLVTGIIVAGIIPVL